MHSILYNILVCHVFSIAHRTDPILSYLGDHQGVIRTSDFQRAGFHNRYLKDLTEEGILVRIKAGLYISTDRLTASGYPEVTLAIPGAVICLASALSYYNLTTYEPPAIHAAVPRDDRIVPPDFPPVHKFSFGKQRYSLGITTVTVEGYTVPIYNQEKTICDAVHFRSRLGQDIMNEAFRNYLSQESCDINRLIEYATLLGSEGSVRNHLRILS